MWCVYGLLLNNGDIYKGCTNNIEGRLKKHREGKVKCTALHLPFEFLFYVALEERKKAFRFEKYLKSGSGGALINRHFL